MEKYKVALFKGLHEFETVELEKPVCGADDVLVKVTSCALCTLEQRIYSGLFKRYPYAGGHEVAGIVESTGARVKGVKPGDKVALRLLHSCGECYQCRTGHPNLCVDQYYAQLHEGYSGAGGLAEYLCVPKTHVYKLAEDTDMDRACLAEPLACCIHSVNAANIYFGEDVVVIGAGVMGLLHVQLAKMRGARVIVTDIDSGRLEKAKAVGADVVINPAQEDSVARVKEETEGRGADAVLCTLAISSLAADSIAMAGKEGRVVFYSAFHPDLPVEFSPSQVHSFEQKIIGALNPTPADFTAAARMLSYGLIDVDCIISDKVPMTEIDRAFAEAVDSSTFRIIVKPQL